MLGSHRLATTDSLHHPLDGGEGFLTSRMPSLLRRVLPGMAASGLGLDLLCCILRVEQPALLDLIVELDLPTPPSLPIRKPGGRNPWCLDDTSLLVILWMSGWHAQSIGAAFGRTPGGIWSKTRRMGLPRRDRKAVFRPSDDLAHDCLTSARLPFASAESRAPIPDSPPPAPTQVPAALVASPQGSVPCVVLPLPVHGEIDLLGAVPIKSKRAGARREIEWTRALDMQLAQRWWARQHYKAIARDMGVSPTAIQSRRFRLELPSHNDEGDLFMMTRKALVDHFDLAAAAANIKEADYVERKCNRFGPDVTFWFWTSRLNGNRTSREFLRVQKKRDSRIVLPPARRPQPPAFPAYA